MRSILLAVTHRYPYNGYYHSLFVKELTDRVAKEFDRVVVFSLNPYLPKNKLLQSIVSRVNPLWLEYANAEDYSYENVEVYFLKCPELPSIKLKMRISIPCFVRKARQLLEKLKIRPSLIHGHFLFPTGVVVSRLSTFFKTPSILTIHGFGVLKLGNKLVPYMKKYLNNNIDFITLASEYVKRSFLNLYPEEEEKIIKIPMGYNEGIFEYLNRQEARTELGYEKNETIFITVASLTKIKNLELAFNSLSYLIEQDILNKDFRYLIVGSGPLKNHLKKVATDLGIGDNIEFLGWKKPEDIHVLDAAADLFLFPSLKEGFGIAPLEAMATGTPVVATRSGGPEEYITSDTGILTGFTVEEFARGIAEGLERRWNRRNISKAVISYSWRSISEKYVEIYQELVADH